MWAFHLSQCAPFWCLLTKKKKKKKKFTFGEQLLEGIPGQRATDLQPLRHNSGCDELVVGNFFVQLVVGSLVEEHQVVELIPHFSLGPLLLRVREMAFVIRKTQWRTLSNPIQRQPWHVKGQIWVYMWHCVPSSWLCLQICWLGPCPFWTSQCPSSCLAWEADNIEEQVINCHPNSNHCGYVWDLTHAVLSVHSRLRML